MTVHYIDTCSLKWRYISGSLTAAVNALLEDSTKDVYTNEITILEWSSVLCQTIRVGEMPQKDFEGHELALFADIADGKLKILPMERSIQRGRDLIRFVNTSAGQQLRTVDSIHLATALELSLRSQGVVEFLTSDKKLNSASSLPIFSAHLIPYYLQP